MQTGLAGPAGVDIVALNQAFTRLQTYDWSDSREALSAIEQAVVATRNNAARRAELEKRLVAALATPASRAAKDFACRQLSVVGTSKSVPALAALLPDPDISHMARFALERIPDTRAAAALRNALSKTQGKTRMGIINSLGTLADAKAVGALAELVDAPESSIAAAAAQALGKIGTSESARALEKYRSSASSTLQLLVSEAYVLAGERLLQKGQCAEAARVFLTVFEQETGNLRLAGFGGLVAAQPEQAVRRLGNALAGDDGPLRNLAARIIAEQAGDKALKSFLDRLQSLPTIGQVVLLDAIHSRGDASARSAVLAAHASGEQRLRLAALRTLGVVGTAEDVSFLARLAAVDSIEERDAARLALANLPGREPSAAILKLLPAEPPPVGVELIRALAARGVIEAAPALTAYLQNSDESVRLGALEALGVLGDEKQATAVITFLKTTSSDSAFQRAGKTLEAIVSRVGPACCDALIHSLADLVGSSSLTGDSGKPSTLNPQRSTLLLLEQLGRIGGSEALKVVVTAVNGQNTLVSEAAFRVLSDWPGIEAVPALLNFARQSNPPDRRELAFHGYVRLCRETQMPASERLNRLSEAAKLAANTSERTLVASALADVPEPSSLKLLAAWLDDAALVDAASVAAVKVASALDARHKGEVIAVLRRVVQCCQTADIQKQAKAVLKEIGAVAD